MEQIINELVDFFGIAVSPETFIDLIIWFIKMCFGCALFRYVLYSIFWLTNQFNKGAKK